MYIVFLAILVIFFIAVSVNGALEVKKYKGVISTEEMMCKDYYQSIALLWCATLAVFIMCFIGNISFEDIGFRFISFNQNIWFTAITLILSGLLLVYSLYQIIFSLTSTKFKEKIKKQMVDAEGATMVLPRSKKERKFFTLLSISAGICEEIIYRGFLAFLLFAIFPGIPIYLIVLIPSALFGIGHAYQGLQGVLITGILGAIFMSLFLVTNSLIPGILLHFLFDFSSTFLISEENIEYSKS